MCNLVIGFVMGLLVATVGFSRLANYADEKVDELKIVIKENVK
jgi:hypothetical protein